MSILYKDRFHISLVLHVYKLHSSVALLKHINIEGIPCNYWLKPDRSKPQGAICIKVDIILAHGL